MTQSEQHNHRITDQPHLWIEMLQCAEEIQQQDKVVFIPKMISLAQGQFNRLFYQFHPHKSREVNVPAVYATLLTLVHSTV